MGADGGVEKGEGARKGFDKCWLGTGFQRGGSESGEKEKEVMERV
jgi:hypothetical protein